LSELHLYVAGEQEVLVGTADGRVVVSLGAIVTVLVMELLTTTLVGLVVSLAARVTVALMAVGRERAVATAANEPRTTDLARNCMMNVEDGLDDTEI
jgi:hypothetical protein